MPPHTTVIDTDYETTAAEDDYDRRAVDAAWTEGGEDVPAEVVWAELGILDSAGATPPAS